MTHQTAHKPIYQTSFLTIFQGIYQYIKQIRLSSTLVLALTALYFAFGLNIAFYQTVFDIYGKFDGFLFSLPILIFFALNAIFQIVALPYVHKILMPVLIIISACIGYNALFYHVYFDTNMLDNVLQTSGTEAGKLITLPFVLWVLAFGVLPALLYIQVNIHYRIWYKELAMRLLMIGLFLMAFGGIAKLYYQDYASFFRNNKQTANLIVPSNFIGASVNKIRHERQANMPHQNIGMDAVQAKQANAKRRVLILVAGETTRGQNWGLNGYTRQTTPKLAALGDELINFTDVTSCGTATAVSLPCMFSAMDFANFDAMRAKKQDNALDIAKRAGVEVLWLDNDTGCKEICNRVPTEDLTGKGDKALCKNGECLDEILLQDFTWRLNNNPNKDLVIVLHTMGSHGPTYFERYTKDFRQFVPTCDTADIATCSHDELVNTYDNGILYIDNFLNAIINELKSHDFDSALYYISDHGESLGENGLYLHGTPYAIAPDYQTKVPMVFWVSKGMADNMRLDNACLHNISKNAYSQDNYFHSVLGLLNIKTKVYEQGKDIFAGCKTPIS